MCRNAPWRTTLLFLCFISAWSVDVKEDQAAAIVKKNWPRLVAILEESKVKVQKAQRGTDGQQISAALTILEGTVVVKGADFAVSNAYDALFLMLGKPELFTENKSNLKLESLDAILRGYFDNSAARPVMDDKQYVEHRRQKLEYAADLMAAIRIPLADAGRPAVQNEPPKPGWSSSVADPKGFRYLSTIRGMVRSKFEGLILSMYRSGHITRDDLTKLTRRAINTQDDTDRLMKMLGNIDESVKDR